jgi:hypothetical protein
MLSGNPWLTMALIAVVVGLLTWRLRLSAWWILVPGLVATGVVVVLYSPVASCNAADSVGTAFGGAIIVAVGLHLGTAIAALLDGIRLAVEREYKRAARRLLPVLAGAALALVTLTVALAAIVGCLS